VGLDTDTSGLAPALASAAVGTVSSDRPGIGSGINNTFRQVGIAVGIAALGAIFQSRVGSLGGKPNAAAFVDGLHVILWVGAIGAAVAAVAAALLLRPERSEARSPRYSSAFQRST